MSEVSLTGNILLYGDDFSLPEIRWITGFSAPDPLLVLVTEGTVNMVVSPLEKGRALRESRGTRVWTLAELGVSASARGLLELWLPAVLTFFKISSVRAPFNTPFGVCEAVRAAGLEVVLVRGAIFPERAVKSEAEFGAIRFAQRATARSMRRAYELIGSSGVDSAGRLTLEGRVLTSERVRAAINGCLLEDGCVGRNTIVAGGGQSADPHHRGNGPLRAGEPIVIDIFPQHERSGYFGDMTRTVCKGAPSPELRRLYAAVRQAQERALDTVRAGVTGAAVHQAAQDAFSELGYVTDLTKRRPEGFIHGTGHGVGLEVHEAPRVSSGSPELIEGNVITVEPGLYYPGLGGVRIEDTVRVTKHGFEFAARCAKKFVFA
jgi:Xaa-Pro aminopeptidase